MVEVEAEYERVQEVTFVVATVTNTRSTPQRIQLASRLDGPVWPPRRGNVVAPEWDGDGWNGSVKPGRSRGVGFASPAKPVDSPVEIVGVRRTDPSESASSRAVLAELDEWSPTSDVLRRER